MTKKKTPLKKWCLFIIICMLFSFLSGAGSEAQAPEKQLCGKYAGTVFQDSGHRIAREKPEIKKPQMRDSRQGFDRERERREQREDREKPAAAVESSREKSPFCFSAAKSKPLQESGCYSPSGFRHSIHEPEAEVFGDRLPYAMSVYQYALTGDMPEGDYLFASQDETDGFIENLRNTVFRDSGVSELAYIHAGITVVNSAEVRMQLYCSLGYENFRDLAAHEEIMADFVSEVIGGGVTDLEFITRLNDWCVKNTVYDYDFNSISYEAEGIVRNHKGTCSGFSDLINEAAAMYGIPCEQVISADQSHVWNRIMIGGEWYHIDATWNVCSGRNNYFLSSVLWDDHRF